MEGLTTAARFWLIFNVFPFLVFIAEMQQSLHNCCPLHLYLSSSGPAVVSLTPDKKHWNGHYIILGTRDTMQSSALHSHVRVIKWS